MKEVGIVIDYPSCRSRNFYSEDFKKALLDDFSNTDYELVITLDASPVGGIFPHGYSLIRCENETEGEMENIAQKVNAVFNMLREKHQ